MANFFSADYWKALYFKAMGGQETAVDPNAMSGSFAGSSSWTGTLDGGAIDAGGADGPDPRKRKKRRILFDYELKAPKDVLVAAREFLSRKKQPPEVKIEELAAVEPLETAVVSDTDDEDEIIMLLLAA